MEIRAVPLSLSPRKPAQHAAQRWWHSMISHLKLYRVLRRFYTVSLHFQAVIALKIQVTNVADGNGIEFVEWECSGCQHNLMTGGLHDLFLPKTLLCFIIFNLIYLQSTSDPFKKYLIFKTCRGKKHFHNIHNVLNFLCSNFVLIQKIILYHVLR